MEFIDVSAKTIEDAIAKGVAELSIDGRELVETKAVSYTHLRAHETCADLVCRLLLEKKKN